MGCGFESHGAHFMTNPPEPLMGNRFVPGCDGFPPAPKGAQVPVPPAAMVSPPSTTAESVAARLDDLKRCDCPTCGVSRDIRAVRDATSLVDRLAKEEYVAIVIAAIEDLDIATTVWVDRDCEQDMSYAWLSDEVEAVLKSPWWKPSRKRLRRALDVAQNY